MSKKILIIDDDSDFVQAVTTLLKAKGYLCVSALSGEAGFNLAKKEKPNLISLDVMMANDSEGIEASRKLSTDSDTKNIPVILVSGIKKVSELAYDYETGERVLAVKEILEKPIDPENFLKVVEKHIAK